MNVSDFLNAIPDPHFDRPGTPKLPSRPPESHRPVPLGRWRRLSLLGTLQAKIAIGSLFCWFRERFKTADERKQTQAEARWQKAAQVFDSMGYMRGAVMKIGQMIANLPDVTPNEFVETLQQLHFNAPALHWSLLQEMFHNELGDEPEQLFDEFNRRAFAAASLGQVHRGRLFGGEEVAIKIQYPGIATAIQQDLKNLTLLLLPSSFSEDGEYLRNQLDNIGTRMKRECDYRLEHDAIVRIGALFQENDGIVIPQVFPHYSSERILTMGYVTGVPFIEFLQTDPPQESRDAIGEKLVRAYYRMWCRGRLGYVDFHPGNILIRPGDQIGLIDFGTLWELDDNEWDYFRRHDEAFSTGDTTLIREANSDWCSFRQGIDTEDTIEESHRFSLWQALPRSHHGKYDFGQESDFRDGVRMFFNLVRKRFVRTHPATTTSIRMQIALRAILHQLRARVDVRSIADEEVVATGWDRSAYAS